MSLLLKIVSEKIGTLIHSMKFLSPEVALYLYKSTIQPWNAVVMSVLVLLVTTWNYQMSYKSGYAGLLFLPLAHWLNVASFTLFYRYYFGRCTPEQPKLVPLPYSPRRSTRFSDRLHDFSVTIPRCYKDVYVNSFLAQLDSAILCL